MSTKNSIRYQDTKERAYYTGAYIMNELIKAKERDPDKVRYLLGSVVFRKIEEYESIREQLEAAFAEWFHEMLAEPNPFV